jgi:glycosyltransferase involved in cell wall biosynthesis
MYSRVPSSDMPAMIRRVHVSVLPSVTTPRWKEQFGRILIESMAAGVPVVGSTCGEIPAVIGDAGLVVAEGDAAALQVALQTLYDASALRRELAQRGRHRAVSLFSSTHVAEATMAAYRAVLGEI